MGIEYRSHSENADRLETVLQNFGRIRFRSCVDLVDPRGNKRIPRSMAGEMR